MSKRGTRDYMIFVPTHACSSNSPKWLETRFTATLDAAFLPCPPSLMVSNKTITGASSASLSAAATAKSLQSCPTLCNPIDGSPSDSPVPGILQARTLEWVPRSLELCEVQRTLQTSMLPPVVNASPPYPQQAEQHIIGSNQNDKSVKRRNN